MKLIKLKFLLFPYPSERKKTINDLRLEKQPYSKIKNNKIKRK